MSKEIIYEDYYWCGICGKKKKKSTIGTVICVNCWDSCVVSGLRQFLLTESPLKTMKNVFVLL